MWGLCDVEPLSYDSIFDPMTCVRVRHSYSGHGRGIWVRRAPLQLDNHPLYLLCPTFLQWMT